jgi:N-acetylglutamate synthase-like GNAT family acetyltransferase
LISGYRISINKAEFDIDAIHAYLSQSYWSPGIPKETLERAIAHSLCFAVFNESNEQVGFARMITDTATFAYLADVYILDAHRNKGLSKWLMQSVADHPDLQGLRRIILATRDAHGLYKQFGFKPLANATTFMELWAPEVYSQLK